MNIANELFTKNGHFSFIEGYTLDKFSVESEIIEFIPKNNIKEKYNNGDYVIYPLSNIMIHSMIFNVELQFHLGKINALYLSIPLKTNSYLDSDFLYRDDDKLFSQWIYHNFGLKIPVQQKWGISKPIVMKWGTVYIAQDPHGLKPKLVFEYKQKNLIMNGTLIKRVTQYFCRVLKIL